MDAWSWQSLVVFGPTIATQFIMVSLYCNPSIRSCRQHHAGDFQESEVILGGAVGRKVARPS
eukprot:2353378-Pyramimonas_sp.AAC.1